MLGRLGEELIGGAMTLDRDGRRAGDRASTSPSRSGSTLVEAADAIIQVANANMADAVRLISIRRGYDPREFCLVAFGGAGPLHGAALAEELSIPTVLVPPNPGITSALGCLLVDVRHDLSAMFLAPRRRGRRRRARGGVREARGRGARAARRPRASPRSRCRIQRSIDMRYLGQWRSLTVPVDAPVDLAERASRASTPSTSASYNYRRDDAPVEIYRLERAAPSA